MSLSVCNQTQKAPAGVFIFFIFLQMRRQIINSARKHRNLHLRAASIGFVHFYRLYNSLLFVLCKHYFIRVA